MSKLINALNSLDVANLSYDEWLRVGMALKHEGYDVSVWDSWSQNDSRYKPGLCEKKWNSFNAVLVPVTGGSIIQMAKEAGWEDSGAMGWDDEISYEREELRKTPVEELKEYLSILFEPGDHVSYVTNDVWNSDGVWIPSKGVYTRTAGELIRSLDAYPDDLGATVGDWKPGCGGWIRFNPVDGKGVKNDNVTSYRFALVESDSMPICDQDAMYRKLQLPIAAMVHSGGKSLHAIVHIDAPDYEEYRKRVEFLYDFLAENGVEVDRANRNPSRLSRMPGLTRNGNRQYLAGTNIGRRDWNDWLSFVEGMSDEFPDFDTAEDYLRDPPPMAEELIKGVLRCGHKMLISGSSKAGKSFLLLELCVALTEGMKWLDFECRPSRVLYINLEIDKPSVANRLNKIYEAYGLVPDHADNLLVWNLRGKAVPLDKLAPVLIRKIKNRGIDAVVLDPIYKVITGDENSASEMGYFCNQFDKICAEAKVSAIYAHHHSKGSQGAKKAIDRSSGSGTFGRDPDAVLDMIELELDDDTRNFIADGDATAWRLEGSLREFPNFKPRNFWFRYPLHYVDEKGTLSASAPEGSMAANLGKSKCRNTAEQRKISIENAFNVLNFEGKVTVNDIASYLGVTPKTVRERIKEMPYSFKNEGGTVSRIDEI